MAALANNNVGTKTKEGAAATREVVAAGTVFGGSLMQRDTNGKSNPVSSAAGIFDGVAPIGSGISSTATDRKIVPAKKGCILATLTSVTVADLGKPVWAPTDNPLDLTLTFTAGAKMVGYVDSLEYNSSGAIANTAWVYFDATLFGELFEHQEKTSPAIIPIAGTVREMIYKVPTGKNSQLYEVNWQQQIKPNFATSATLQLNRVRGAVRTALITPVDVNNVVTAVDTPTAAVLTNVFELLIAGDCLEAQIVTVGGLTTAGKLNIHTNLQEYAKI